jgi:pantoate--beta-alanine ligase
MAADLNLGVEIVGVATVRDSDGLALSSRNQFLSADERARAVALPNALETAKAAILAGAQVAATIREAKQSLVDAGFLKIDYVALVDGATLEPLDEPKGSTRLIAAAVMGTTRLIDNMPVETD